MVMPDVICVPNNNKSDTCAPYKVLASHSIISMFQALFNREGFLVVLSLLRSTQFLFYCCSVVSTTFCATLMVFLCDCKNEQIKMGSGAMRWCCSWTHYCSYYYSSAPSFHLFCVYFVCILCVVRIKGKNMIYEASER
jgi:hypothetical protein